MRKTSELLVAAQEAFQKVWFVQSLDVFERTDQTLSIRLTIRTGLFVQAFIGEITGSLYFALIEGRHRVFGIDRESGEWHEHPFGTPEKHKPLEEGLEPKPLLQFLSRVEEILLEENLMLSRFLAFKRGWGDGGSPSPGTELWSASHEHTRALFSDFPLATCETHRAKLIVDGLSSLAPLLYRRGSTNILPPPPLTSAILSAILILSLRGGVLCRRSNLQVTKRGLLR